MLLTSVKLHLLNIIIFFFSLFIFFHHRRVLDTKARKPSAKKSSRTGTAKRPGSNRSKVSFTDEQQQSSPSPTVTITKPYTFIGYNLGDDIVHVTTDQSYLFPKNGALVRVETLCYTQQSTTTQITVMYKGDTFSVNFSNPVHPKDACCTTTVNNSDQDSPRTIEKGLTNYLSSYLLICCSNLLELKCFLRPTFSGLQR